MNKEAITTGIRIAQRIHPEFEEHMPYHALLVVPKKHYDYRPLFDYYSTPTEAVDIHRVLDGESHLFSGYLIDKKIRSTRNPKVSNHEFSLATHYGVIKFSVFGGFRLFGDSARLDDQYNAKVLTHIYGSIEFFGQQPYFKKHHVVNEEDVGFIRPVYPRIYGVAKDKVQSALRDIADSKTMIEQCANELSQKTGLDYEKLALAIRSMHAPISDKGLDRMHTWAENVSARHLVQSIQSEHKINPRSVIQIDNKVRDEIMARAGFELSPSQKNAFNDSLRELASEYPSNHLLSGDVGSGKTIVYAMAAAAAQAQGKRVAILVPNTLLLGQVFEEVQRISQNQAFLVKAGTKPKTIQNLEGCPILVGTTSLFSAAKDIEFDLVIVDEQQKLSEEQRKQLSSMHTNYIQSTATCLPGTYGQVMFGASTSSIIEQHVEKNIESRVYSTDNKDRQEVMQTLSERLSNGSRMAIIYPELNSDDPKRGILQAFSTWNRLYPDRVVMLHGKMKDTEKERALLEFQEGRSDILVATTVIEIGLTLKGLDTVVVIGAECMGASTLHQIRGRTARHGGEGLFIMVYEPSESSDKDDAEDGDETVDQILARLTMVAETNNGFELAKKDAELRGVGNLGAGDLGKQHGKSNGLIFYGIEMPADAIKASIERSRLMCNNQPIELKESGIER